MMKSARSAALARLLHFFHFERVASRTDIVPDGVVEEDIFFADHGESVRGGNGMVTERMFHAIVRICPGGHS